MKLPQHSSFPVRHVCAAAAITLAACAHTTPTAAPLPSIQPDNTLPSAVQSDPTRWRGVWLMTNLNDDAAVVKDIELAQKASKLGYTHMVVSDVKFMKWDMMSPRYASNARKFVDTCHSLNLKVWACCAPMGYAESLLMRDPNLAEGLPVEGDFVVDQGLFLKPYDEDLRLQNGDFTKVVDNAPAAWTSSNFNKSIFIDKDVTWNGKPTLRIEPAARPQDISGEARAAGETTYAPGVSQDIDVKPFHYYHVKAMVKTEGASLKRATQVEVVADQPGHPDDKTRLNYQTPLLPATTDWQEFHMTFNSLEFSRVKLTLPGRQSRGGGGAGNQGSGIVHWADIAIEPGGFVNVIRRDGAPVNVTGMRVMPHSNKPPEGWIIDFPTISEKKNSNPWVHVDPILSLGEYKLKVTEGKDLTPIIDPLMGHSPGVGHFNIWHTPPVVNIIPGSRLHVGDRVHVSYYVPGIIHDSQVMCCMAEPKTIDTVKWEIKNIHKHMNPDGYFTGHDELRSQGYDKSCVDYGGGGKSMHELLADNVKTITDIIKHEDPGKEICTWSDLFDPFHNAKNDNKRYYLVKGKSPWYGAWTGLDKDIIIMNWHNHDANNNASTRHFADLGNRQILSGYYDKADLSAFKTRLENASHYPGVIGSMYTTWTSNFTIMEPFAQLLNDWKKQNAKQNP